MRDQNVNPVGALLAPKTKGRYAPRAANHRQREEYIVGSRFETTWAHFLSEAQQNAYEAAVNSDGFWDKSVDPDFHAAAKGLRADYAGRGLKVSKRVADRCGEILQERRDGALERNLMG